MPTSRRLLVVLASALIAIGCSDDASDPLEALPGAGTAVFNGIEVVDGSRLLGVVPDAEQTGRVALLAVDGDPADVFDGYVAQYAQLGVRMKMQGSQSGSDDGGCPRGIARVQAVGSSERISMTLLWNTSDDEDAAWTQHLVLADARTETPPGEPVSVDLETIGPSEDFPAERRSVPDIPTTGDRIALAPEYDPSEELRVVEGSQLLGPAAPNCGVTGGLYAMVNIDGELDEVVGEYLDVIRSSPEVDRTLQDGSTRYWYASDAGGPKLAVTAVPKDGGWVALLDVSND